VWVGVEEIGIERVRKNRTNPQKVIVVAMGTENVGISAVVGVIPGARRVELLLGPGINLH